jgi:multidrug efflux pump subunit AcrB
MALLIVVLGVTSIRSMRTDIFPEIEIPVVNVIWTFKGMESSELEKRITTYSEYAYTSNVNEIKRIESQTLNGVAIIKIYFHESVDIGTALSQVTSASQAIRALMPPGIQPPIILRFNASSVPILQISLSSDTLSEESVYDYGLFILRNQLSTIQGLTMPTPYGGRERQVMVDLDPQLLQAKGISPKEVADAINAYNLASPTGVARIDTHEYPVTLNNTPVTPAQFNDIPIKVVNGATIHMRDVAQVRDGSQAQTTIVRRNGSRGALVTLLKNGNASTLDIVNQVKEMLPAIKASAPKGLDINLLFDQSLFVTAAVHGVVVESIIAGLLTAGMILLFLGSWRSTLIVAVSIPLAILTSIVGLYLLGYSLNVMTLGGLALAVGILVDDATVEIENIHRNVHLGKPLRQAILDGAAQIAAPTFVSTLTISIVFVSVLFLEGAPKYLFTPLALAVAFAMLASYLLSRTIVPTMVDYLLPAELATHGHEAVQGSGFRVQGSEFAVQGSEFRVQGSDARGSVSEIRTFTTEAQGHRAGTEKTGEGIVFEGIERSEAGRQRQENANLKLQNAEGISDRHENTKVRKQEIEAFTTEAQGHRGSTEKTGEGTGFEGAEGVAAGRQRQENGEQTERHRGRSLQVLGFFGRFHAAFERSFERFRDGYVRVLEWNLKNARTALLGFGIVAASGVLMVPFVGRDFFPTVDTGQFRLHVRAPAGTRIEQTERYFSEVENAIRQIIPKDEVELVLDNIGLPNRTYAMAFGDSATTSMADGEILVALAEHRGTSTQAYMARLRDELPRRFPELTFFFQPADIVSQILNFGLPAPIDIQVSGMNRAENEKIAGEIAEKIRHIAGVKDVHLHQVTNVPKLHIDVDQTRARELGFTQQDVANSVLVSLSGSGQVQPNYWVDPKMGISYLVETRTPVHRLDSVDAINGLALTAGAGAASRIGNGSGSRGAGVSPEAVASASQEASVQLLSNVAKIGRGVTAEVANHVNVQPTFDVYAAVQDRDLGSVAAEINKVLDTYRAKLAPGNTLTMRGQVESMNSAFWRLGLGIIFAAVLVYLLMVVNFQSWLDPLIIISALPGAGAGIVWSLWLWDTTFSVPALMGAIMSIGVATANSILLVTFANEQRDEGRSAYEAALEAGRTRLRPVLMTAAAMIIGMLPMSLGLGEGGEQNAPLGRAVIGGLLLATVTTLLFVPVIFQLLRRKERVVQA